MLNGLMKLVGPGTVKVKILLSITLTDFRTFGKPCAYEYCLQRSVGDGSVFYTYIDDFTVNLSSTNFILNFNCHGIL